MTVPPTEARSVADLESRVAEEWQVGDVLLDTYEVTAILGAGGMGRVYKVHHRGWDVDLAVKSPLPKTLARAGGAADFVREAETWVNLGLHPHVVSCHYVRTLGGIPRLFAEYVDGGSLSDWIQDGRLYAEGAQPALARILDVALQFAWGLAHAHEQGLVHQDVKPGNVMMTAAGVAKVTDFGLAKARVQTGPSGEAASGHDPRVSVGGMTPAYCSPEQARREPVSPATDVWSWAVSVLEMFTGGVTWGAGQVAPEALAAIAEAEPDPGRPRLPPALRAVLEACFDPDPARRPRASDAAQALRAAAPGARTPPSAAALNADSLNNRALSLLDLGRAEEAVAAWDQALAINPLHMPSHYNRGLWQWRHGMTTDEVLVGRLEELAATHPDAGEAAVLVAGVHLERGRADKAAAYLQPRVASSPEAARLLALAERRRSARPLAEHVARHLADPDVRRYFVLSRRNETTHAAAIDRNWHALVNLWIESTAPSTETAISETAIPEYLPYTAKIEIWDPSTLERRHASRWPIPVTEGMRRELERPHPTKLPLSSLLVPRMPVVSLSAEGDYALAVLGVAGGSQCSVWRVAEGRREATFEAGYHDWQLGSQGRHALGTWPKHGESGGSIEAVLYDGRTGRRGWSWTVEGGPAGSRWRGVPIVRLATGPACFQTIDRGTRVEALAFVNGVEAAPERLGVLEGHGSPVLDLDTTPDGRLLLVGAEDGTIGLWDVPGMRCLTTLGAGDAPRAVRFSPDGRRALHLTYRGLSVWDLAEGRLVGRVPSVAGADQVSPDGRLAVSLSLPRKHDPDRLVRLHETETGRCLTTFHEAVAGLCSLSPDGRRLVAFTGAGFRLRSLEWEPFRAPDRLCRAASGSALVERHAAFEQALERADVARARGDRAGWLEAVRRARSLPGHEQDLRVHEHWRGLGLRLRRRALTSGWEVARIAAVGARVSASDRKRLPADDPVDLSGDGRRVAAAQEDGSISVWDVESRRPIARLGPEAGRDGKPVATGALALSFDGQGLISGHSDGCLRLWDVGSARATSTLRGHRHPVRAVRMSQDQRVAVSADHDRERRVWDLAAGRSVHVRPGFSRETEEIRLSEDGLTAVWLSTRFCVESFDTARGQVLREFEQSGDRGTVYSLAASRAFDLLVVSTSTGLVTWDLHSGECRATHQVPMLTSLQLTTCGGYALGCADGRLYVVDLTSGRVIQRATAQGGSEVAPPFRLSQDGAVGVACVGDVVSLWAFDWDLDAESPPEWDSGARPYLARFLAARRPWATDGTLGRVGRPAWTKADLDGLLHTLACAGYGEMSPAAVSRELERLATER